MAIAKGSAIEVARELEYLRATYEEHLRVQQNEDFARNA